MKKCMYLCVLLISMIALQGVYAQNSVNITTNPSPATICQGAGTNVTLTAEKTGGIVASYQWSTSQTGSSIMVSPAITTVYTVTVAFATGSPDTVIATTTVTVIPEPSQATITPIGLTTFCTGDSVELVASAGTAYVWYRNGNIISGATEQTYFAKTSGDYRVLVTVEPCNAPMSAITAVTVVAPPTAEVTPDGPLDVCYGDSTTLTAYEVTGATYQWQYSPDGLGSWSNIADATNRTYDVDLSGFYRIAVTLGTCTNYSN